MIKSQQEVLQSLKSFYLPLITQPVSLEYRQGHLMALMCMAYWWGIEEEFSQWVEKQEQQFMIGVRNDNPKKKEVS